MSRLVPWWAYIWVIASILTAAVWFSIPAHAGPGDREVRRYAESVATAVCSTLDSYPSLGGVKGVIAAIKADGGFGDYEAGEVIAIAVQEDCPRYLPLLQRFVAVYGDTSV